MTEVEKKLKIKSSEQKKALTNEELQTAGEMFLYLNMCPDTMKPWLVFYKDLFQSHSPDQIILTLNRLMKGTKTQTKEFFENMAHIFLNRVLKLLPTREAGKRASRPLQELEGVYI